jgi:hypothetical protein
MMYSDYASSSATLQRRCLVTLFYGTTEPESRRPTHQAYCTLKPLSPDFVAMSDCSTLLTDAAEGPWFKCWTNWLRASSLPWASPATCIESISDANKGR